MKVDLTEVIQVQDASLAELKNIDRAMRRYVQKAAAYERANHYYQNRTGNLERSTQGSVTKDGDTFEVSLVMGMDYASYVVGRGFSQIDVAEKMLETDIENYLNNLGLFF